MAAAIKKNFPDIHQAQAPAAKASGAWNLMALPDAALSVGSNIAALPGEAYTGIKGMLTNGRAGMRQTSADIDAYRQEHTYTPRTQGGQMLTDAVNYLPQKYGQMADNAGMGVTNMTGSAGLGAATDVGIQSLPLVLGTALGARGAAGKTAAPSVSTATPEVQAATNAGFKLTPEQAQSGFMGQAAQSLTGGAKLERMMSRKNAPVVNQLAADEIGVNGPLSNASIQQAKAAPNAVYDAASKTGQVALDPAKFAGVKAAGTLQDPAIQALQDHYATMGTIDAQDLLTDMRQLRAHAAKNIKAPNAPAQNDLGWAQQKASGALEDSLQDHLNGMGPQAPVTIDEFRDARTTLAKIHSVEDAFDGKNVSPKDLAKQAERRVPLSGNLRTIADAASNFDRSFQDVSKIRNSGPFSGTDPLLGAIAGLSHPAGWAAMLGPPAVRSMLASGAFQRAVVAGKGLPSMSVPGGLIGAGSSVPLLEAQQRRGLLQ